MNKTINIPLLNQDSFYTPAQATALFNAVAVRLNGKLDVRQGEVELLSANGQRVINVSEGSDPMDGVTVAQVIRAKQTGTVTKQSVDSQYQVQYTEFIPIMVTEENFSEAVRENILAIREVVKNKVSAYATAPFKTALEGAGSRLRLVGNGVHPNDLCNVATALEILNDPSI